MKINHFGLLTKYFALSCSFLINVVFCRELLEYFVFGCAASEPLQCSVSWESGAFTTD